MAQELLYTSAPRGLKSGSRGFCTVEATGGMPPALVTALENLSAYRHVAAPGDPANPVVYSHVTLSIGGRRCSVVSRIADAGADYTGRTNKLAHHLAFDGAERPKGGPAWLAGQPNVLRSRFDGEPRTLPPRTVPQGDRPPALCKSWQAVTGDAGWAGVLAEAFLADPNRPAYIVIPAGIDLRPLFEETIALLPPDRRWEPTFTTCYTSLPQNVTCLWRGVLAGSKEANESRRFVQALRIDLTKPLGPAAGGTLVEAARTGRMPAVASPPAERKSTSAAAIARSGGPSQTRDDAPLDTMPPAATPRRPDQFLIEPLERPPALRRPSRWKAVLWTGAAVLCLAVTASPVVLFVKDVSKRAAPRQQVAAAAAAATPPDTPQDPQPGEGEPGGPAEWPEGASNGSPVDEGPERSESTDSVPEEGMLDAGNGTTEPTQENGGEESSEPSIPDPNSGGDSADDATDAGRTPLGGGDAPTQLASEDPLDAEELPENEDRFEFQAILLSDKIEGEYVVDEFTISQDELEHKSLDLWLPESFDGEYSVKNRGTNDITVYRDATASRLACRIRFKAIQDGEAELFVKVSDRYIKQLLLAAVLAISDNRTPNIEPKAFLLRSKEPDASVLPQKFSRGRLEWTLPEVPESVLKSLRVKQVTVNWLDQPRQFEAFASDSDLSGSKREYRSESIKAHIEDTISYIPLQSEIIANPPHIEFSQKNLTWSFQMKPGYLWSGFKGAAGGYLSEIATDWRGLGLGHEINDRSIHHFFSWEGIAGEGSEGKAKSIGKRLNEEIENVSSKNDDGDDKTDGRLARLSRLQEDYNQIRKSALASKCGKQDLWEAQVMSADIVIVVKNGEEDVEVPFLTVP